MSKKSLIVSVISTIIGFILGVFLYLMVVKWLGVLLLVIDFFCILGVDRIAEAFYIDYNKSWKDFFAGFSTIIFILLCVMLLKSCMVTTGRSSSSDDDYGVTTTDDYGKADAWDFDKDGKLNQREMEQYSKAVRREVEGIK